MWIDFDYHATSFPQVALSLEKTVLAADIKTNWAVFY